MKGILLAGGKGTRLFPLTRIIHKHLLPIGPYPMIGHGILKLKEAGLRDIVLVVGEETAGIYRRIIGDGGEWGVRLSYRVQAEAGGIAQALLQAEQAVGRGESMAVLLGDNLFEDRLSPLIANYLQRGGGAGVVLKRVADPRSYGVPVLKNGRIAAILEKPQHPPAPYCVTGIYFYDTEVFAIIRSLSPSTRGELEITDVNNEYVRRGALHFDVLDGWWTDAGTFPALREACGRFGNRESGLI